MMTTAAVIGNEIKGNPWMMRELDDIETVMITQNNIEKRSASRSSEYLPALELTKGCAIKPLPKCGGEQER